MPSLQNRPLAANQQDLSDGLNDVLLDGLLASATAEQRQLIADPASASAVPSFRQILLQVIQYNLDAIQNIALTPTRCALAPLQQSRLAIEGARDSALACLVSWRANQQQSVYSSCLQAIYPTAQREIDSLRPSIDACLQAVARDIASANGTQTTSGQNSNNVNWTQNVIFDRIKCLIFIALRWWSLRFSPWGNSVCQMIIQ